MKQYICEISNTELRELCVANDWFTAGDSEQYQKLFELNESHVPTSTLATVIWTCSSGADLADINEKLEKAASWPIWLDSVDAALQRAGFGDTEREIVAEALRTNSANGTCYHTVEG